MTFKLLFGLPAVLTQCPHCCGMLKASTCMLGCMHCPCSVCAGVAAPCCCLSKSKHEIFHLKHGFTEPLHAGSLAQQLQHRCLAAACYCTPHPAEQLSHAGCCKDSRKPIHCCNSHCCILMLHMQRGLMTSPPLGPPLPCPYKVSPWYTPTCVAITRS